MKDKNTSSVVNFDYVSYPNTYHNLMMLAVKLKRVKCIKKLWGIENKNAYTNG
jgi:Zn-dependent M28 family amino/carboxypeptidase